MKKTKSENLYQQACKVLPGGVSRNTIYRKPHPFYVKKASGCYVTDIEGVERIDFANNMASLIHGHSHPEIVQTITEQLQSGTAFTMATEAEIRFAELLCERSPDFEKIRFVNSGTEAVMAMIKTARAYTGKEKIAKVEGAYHGTYDFAEISQTASPDNWGIIDSPNSVPVAKGTPQGVLNDVLIIPYNDIDRAIKILDQQADQVAGVLIDPIAHRVGMIPATEKFINALSQWSRKNDALLMFDEVITFRTLYGGAQERYSVKPDLTALGKMIGGGFPVGAFTGRAEIMKVLDPSLSSIPVPHSGTFSANPITMKAGKIAMDLFDKQAIDQINQLSQIAKKQIREAIKQADIPACVTGEGSMFRLHLKPKAPTSYREAWLNQDETVVLKKLLDHLFKNGMMMINTCSVAMSTAITQKEVDRLTESMLSGFITIKPDLEIL